MPREERGRFGDVGPRVVLCAYLHVAPAHRLVKRATLRGDENSGITHDKAIIAVGLRHSSSSFTPGQRPQSRALLGTQVVDVASAGTTQSTKGIVNWHVTSCECVHLVGRGSRGNDLVLRRRTRHELRAKAQEVPLVRGEVDITDADDVRNATRHYFAVSESKAGTHLVAQLLANTSGQRRRTVPDMSVAGSGGSTRRAMQPP